MFEEIASKKEKQSIRKTAEIGYCLIQPRQGRYGTCGWDLIVYGHPCILFETRKKATRFAKYRGFEILNFNKKKKKMEEI